MLNFNFFRIFSLDSDNSLFDVDAAARRLCELSRTMFSHRSRPIISSYGDGTTNMLFFDSLKRFCRSKRQVKRRVPELSESRETSSLGQVKGDPEAEYDVMWPAYVPLKLSMFQKRRWGDTISSCIQSKCSSFFGTTRVGCIVQHCQRKRSADVY